MKRKSKAHRILNAVEALNKAMSMEDPHIVINLPGGSYDTDESKEFVASIKTFIRAYKKFYGLKKVRLELTL